MTKTKVPIQKKIGKNIRFLRQQKRLLQRKLAADLNVGKNVISNWECGRTPPSTEDLEALSKFFGVSIDEIFYAEPTLVYLLGDGRLLWRGNYWGICSPDEQVFSRQRSLQGSGRLAANSYRIDDRF